MDFAELQKQLSDAGDASTQAKLPDVDQWNPPFCGDMNLVIKRNGQWWHEGTPFTRAKLISLLSSVLKKEGEDYFLVTPVEKIGITVEDVPFVVISDTKVEAVDEEFINEESINKKSVEVDDHKTIHPSIQISTQTGDTVLISKQHPVELRVFQGNLVPYCHIRRNLWARVHQNVLYRWLDSAKIVNDATGNKTQLTLQSGNYVFCVGEFVE